MEQYREIDIDIHYLEKRLEENGKKLSGCKILTSQAVRFLDFFKFIEYYQEAFFIFLSRRNSIKAEISGEIARRFQRRHLQERHPQLLQVQLNPVDFYRRLQWRSLRNDFVRGLMVAYHVPMLDINYEDLFANKTGEIKRILDFLKVERDIKVIKSIYSNEERANPFLIKEMIENYEEVKAFLKSYPGYYYMLTDD